MIGAHVVKNGKMVSKEEAVVPVTLREVQYGFFTYESLRVLHGEVVHLEDHLERLAHSAEGIRLTHPFSYKDIGSWVHALIAADGISDATMKITLYGGPEAMCFVTASKILSYPDAYYQHGVKVITYEGERLMPSCKTGNLLLNYMALEEAHRHDGFEAELVDRNGEILEGTRSNFYAFHDGTIYTAPDGKVLLGVTRSSVLRAAKQLCYPVVFQAPKRRDLLSGVYDEAFISATSMGAMPVSQLDGKMFTLPKERTNRICALVRSWELEDEK
jgi:D-alanine transaminase/branched-chain amino acid aminotransferase